MGSTIRIAWRNLGRNRRRTIITVVAIAFGLMLLVVSGILGDGFHAQMIDRGVADQAGHVVVQGPGYQDTREEHIVVDGAGEVRDELKALFPEATIVSRVFLQGLLTSPRGSVGAQLIGIVPEIESEVSTLPETLVDGGYVSNPEDIVIGRTLAENLDVDLGDKVVLMTQQRGEIQSRLFRVSGLFHTGMDAMDGFLAHVHIEAAQALLGVGNAATQVAVQLTDADRTAEATGRVRAALAGRPVEVLPWQEALPELHQFVVIDDAGLYVFILVIAFIVAMGVLNTVLMSVLERMREFGVLLSIGLSPGRLALLVMSEATLIGLLAVTAGVALGLLLGWPLVTHGLDYGALLGGEGGFETAGVLVDPQVYGEIRPSKIALFALITLGLTVVSALYPALKAARLQPVEAMHHQ